MSRIEWWGRRAIKRATALGDALSWRPRGVVILIYHRVGRRTDVSVDLPEWLFEEQISRLAEEGRAMTLDAALEALKSDPPAVGPDPVVVTFDDGTADFAELAVPILERYGVPATIYVATDFIEESRPFPDDGRPLSWKALEDAASTGLVTVGSHTSTHPMLDHLEPTAVAAELDRSKELIGERLGVDARHFAYPRAVLALPAGEAEVRSRFTSAAVAGTRPNPYGATDPYRLARSPIQVDDGMRYFERKVSGGMRLEDSIRRGVRRARVMT